MAPLTDFTDVRHRSSLLDVQINNSSEYSLGCNHLESFRWVLGSSIYCNCKAPTFNHLLLQAGRTLQSSSSTDTLPIPPILTQ